MLVDIHPTPSSSAGSPFQQTATATSAPPSPAMSSPSTPAHESTLFTTFDSSTNTTDPHPRRLVLDADQDKLDSVLSAPHPPSTTMPATSIHKNVPITSSVAEAGVSVPLPADSAARGVEQGVSPVINAFRSPYPHSPSYFVTVVPPDDFPMSPEVSQHERNRMQRGSLLPLYPTLGGQLWAISREFALPSLGGLMLYLSDDGQGNRGPRIGDATWQALWARYFDESDGPSTSICKPQTAFAPSRRSSIIAGDSFADASATSAAHAADVSRSTLGEASSSRPNLPYLSSRPLPSPRVEALSFPRRDTSADWSPSSRSAGWSANVSSSAGPAAVPFSFPHLPILARIEWQIDSVKAPWWPAWVASRSAPRERPPHKTRKSLHLPNTLSHTTKDALGVHHDHDETDDEKDQDGEQKEDHQEDYSDQFQVPRTRNLESNASQLPLEHVETADAGLSAPRSISPALSGLAEHQPFTAVSAPTDPVIAHDEHQESPPSIAPSASARSLPHLENGPEVPVEENAIFNETPETDSIIKQASERRSPSPSDGPLKSERASILSMSWPGSRRTSDASHASALARPTDASDASDALDALPPITSTAAESEHALAHRYLDIDDATTSHRDASDQSRTGYTEILDISDAHDQDTEDKDDLIGDPVLHARDGDYAALPDSPSSEMQELRRLPVLASASDREQHRFSQAGFPLRHSFIVDAGDEAMWRDLHHHDMDPMTPEPLEDTRTLPTENHQPESEEQAKQQTHAEERSSSLELIHKSDYDVAIHQHTQPAPHPLDTHAVAQDPRDLCHQQRLVQVDDFAHDAYYSPQRSKVARIQSWIGKTPTGRPNSSGAFDEDDFDKHADDQGLQLPAESDFDEVVGLWASKVRQDPYEIPHISGPTASVSGEGEERARDEQDEVQIVERQHHATDQRSGEVSSLAATTAPALSLLSPIHLDAAAFDGVRPQLGKLSVPAPPQLLSPTAVADAFNTPRASPDQRSVSTPILQQHPPSSPASLAPPLDRKNSSASRRSSGDLSDTLQEMEKALQLLSPSCSPNPALAPSPDPTVRKMSSRDSLAYARSLSASVTPSPKWIARAKAATVKSRKHARRTYAVGGSPFDLGQVSPRPASTSAVSSSRARSPGLRAPLSASRLIEFAQADAIARQARTEIGDLESTRSGDTIGGDLDTEAAPSIVSLAAVEAQSTQEPPSLVTSSQPLAKEVQAPSSVEDGELDGAERTTNKATDSEIVSDEPVEAVPSSVEACLQAAEPSLPSAPEAKADEADETQGMSAFMTDDHDVGIASIQRFLRGKVVSAGESDASLLHDRTTSVSDHHRDSSAAGTIIERSASLDSELRSATASEQRTDQAEAVARAAIESRESQSLKESASEPRWTRASYASEHLEPRHLSGSAYSVNSTSPKRDRHHEVHTDSFTYQLSSEPTTMDTQLSRAGTDGEGLSVAGEVVKSYLSSSPSDEVFFISSGPARAPARARDQQHTQQSDQRQNQSEPAAAGLAQDGESGSGQQQQHLSSEETRSDEADEHHTSSALYAMEPTTTNGSVPTLAYRFASSPVHPELLTIPGPLAGTHDGSLDEDEIRTMHEDTRAAVREALSQSTAHHVNIVPAVAPPATAAVGGPLSPKSTSSPLSSPLSSHSSLGDHFRRRGSASSLNLTSTGGGSASNASSPNLNGHNAVLPAARRRPAKLNLDIDGLARSPPSAAVTASARRLPPTSPRSRFGQLPPSPSLHPSYKVAMSSPLSQSSPQMGLGSPRGKTFLPSLTSVTSLEGELA